MGSEYDFKIGNRIECDGFNATIRYIGEVPPTKGVWLGVEWDDPSRGKHNGLFEGTQYFSTKHPQSGSFLRPRKVNKGVDFLLALVDRYGIADDGSAGIKEEEMFVRGRTTQQTKIEVVGAVTLNMKQSKFDRLLDVGLREQLISDVGEQGAVNKVCPNIQELNVSLNLFSSWKQIASLVSQLPQLRVLDVSSNVLEVPENPGSLSESFSALKTLYLNKMSYAWEEVYQCGILWQKLEELHACFNDISVITNPMPNLQHLKMLNLEGNPLRDWMSVSALGVLPNLTTLILNRVGLKEIYFNDTQWNCKSDLFPNLESLSICWNELSKWKSIDELNKLKKLRVLKFLMNPLSKSADDATVRSVTIAKIAGLKSLNRSFIEIDERKGAEYDYIKKFGLDWKAAREYGDPENNVLHPLFVEAHPIYQVLLNRYGTPEDSELKQTSSALKNNLLTLSIDCPKIPSKKPVSKKLPRTMTVQKLRALLARLYKVNGDDIVITYTSQKMDFQDIELDNDLREIGFFAIEDDDTIHVNF